MAPFGSQEENGEATTIIINDKEEKSFFFPFLGSKHTLTESSQFQKGENNTGKE
jgi:hypothetical protein